MADEFNLEDDYGMDVDDLFGDSESVNLGSQLGGQITGNLDGHELNGQLGNQLNGQLPVPMPPRPLLKYLPERLADLHAAGCKQNISWSRFGLLAAISSDNKSVELYNFSRDPQDGEWKLSQKIPFRIPPLPEGSYFSHVAWSYLGNDLALADSVGHVHVFSMGNSLGRLQPLHSTSRGHFGDVTSIVGLHWLPVFPQNQKNHVFWKGSRNQGEWNYQLSNHLFPGPHNPCEGRSAVLVLHKSSQLRLLFQVQDGRWLETTTMLPDSTQSSESLLSHAAFAPENLPDNDPTLLMATYNMSCSLKVCRIRIEWQPQTAANPGQGNGEGPTLNMPAIKLSPVTSESDCFPPSSLTSEGDGLSIEPRPYIPTLTHLEFLPSEPERVHADKTYPTVLGVFHEFSAPSSADALLGDTSRPYFCHATACAWELKAAPPAKLSEAFDSLSGKKRPLSTYFPQGQQWRLHQKPAWSSNVAVISIVSLRFNTVLAVAYADGSIEFRDRSTMSTIVTEQDPAEIYTLMQGGFAFLNAPPSLHIAFSPNYCIAAVLHDDDEKTDKGSRITIRKMEYLMGDLAHPSEGMATAPGSGMVSNAAVALALHHSCACGQLCTTDDIFAMLGSNAHVSVINEFFQQAIRAMNLNLDYSTEEAQKNAYQLFRVPALYKTLSAQAGMGTVKHGFRNVSGKLAWITLNLKLIATSLTMSIRHNEPLKLDLAISLIGHVKYSLDFLVYVLQDLYDLARELLGHEQNLVRIQSKVDDANSPVLAVMLASVPRLLIRTCVRSLKNAYIHSINCMKAATTPDQKADWHRVSAPFRDTPLLALLQQQHLDNFLKELDASIKQCYAAAREPGKNGPISADGRSKIERELFITGKIPPLLGPAVVRIFQVSLPNMSKHLDPYRIYAHDVSWLGLTDDGPSRRFLPASYDLSIQHKRSAPNDGAEPIQATAGAPASGKQPANMAGSTNANNAPGSAAATTVPPDQPPILRATMVRAPTGSSASGGRPVPMIDVIRKTPLREGAAIRRCTRCGSVSEELAWGPGMQPWMAQNYKACVCSCSWACV
ncbi:hypothetical protein P152DRAFT_21888 [Eremomyces bilateralis CBS 781.70]|uniref:Mediator of RNA polymerase II transcription subunit 16 n=1 Tax=Eremomyces bilateralis CBS 781.70 TaxID=1392243 RepID=A0A6G1GHE0_9PEZI|nr:uncharacterized protein P152DRAFT_21888 [Eremomyces bilateralis CBS 781.70]KAF1817517.1 hypothetical protein P152DRAFT_21888 [Eremomyces bilateralis CBS 781.70]